MNFILYQPAWFFSIPSYLTPPHPTGRPALRSVTKHLLHVQPAAPKARGREDTSGRVPMHTRGRSMGASGSGGGGGDGSSGRGRATEVPNNNVPPKRHRSKSRSGRFVSQLKGIVKGKSSSSRRGSMRSGDSLSDDYDDDYEDENDGGNAVDSSAGWVEGGGGLTGSSSAAQPPEAAREPPRNGNHRRVSSAAPSLGQGHVGSAASAFAFRGSPEGSNLERQTGPPGSLSALKGAAEPLVMVGGSRLPPPPPAMPLSGSAAGSRGVRRVASVRGSALKPPAPRNSE